MRTTINSKSETIVVAEARMIFPMGTNFPFTEGLQINDVIRISDGFLQEQGIFGIGEGFFQRFALK